MRFAVAVAAGALAASPAFLRMEGWIETGAAVRLAFLLLAGVGAGFIARRRAALAGFLAVAAAPLVVGALSYSLRQADVSLAEAAAYELRLVIFTLPYAVAAAAAGALGGWLRARAMGAAR